jgi:2-dehydropantoate 2-reductase
MKTAIIGSGGVGGYFGAKIASAGHDVTFLARGAHAAAMKLKGLQIKSVDGDFHLEQVKLKESIAEMEPADLVLLGVKAWQIKEIREELKAIVHDKTMIVPLQNGLLAADELVKAIDQKNILAGLCRIMSKIEEPGVIHHWGVTPAIVFGELNKTITPRVQQLNEFLSSAGIESFVSDDMEMELWKKFIPICVSGLLAVTRTNYGELRELPETRRMMIDLMEENFALAQKLEINITRDFMDKAIAAIDRLPYDSTSSLTRDVLQCKPSEIYYQNGTAVKLGEELGIPTPVNRFVFHCILPGEIKAREGSKI